MMKRWIKFSFVALFILMVLSVIILPPVAKWYIEEHSEEWTGRKIIMEDLGINFFTGGITIESIKVLEASATAVFFAADRIYVNTEPWRAVTGSYEIIEVTIDKPELTIVQSDEKFNFDDLVTRFTTDTDTVESTESEPLRYRISNTIVNNGAIHYENKGLGNSISFVNMNSTLPLLAWDDPQHHYTLQVNIDKGGSIQSVLDLNTESLAYVLKYKMEGLNLDVLYPYLKDYIRVGEMKGAINTALNLYGNFNEPEAIAATGTASLHDLSITDENQEPLISLGTFAIDLDTINVKSDIYNLHSISLRKPFLKFERFETENNFSRLMDYGSSDSTSTSDSLDVNLESGNILELLATYVHDLSQNYAISNYRADSVTVSDGTLIFNDYTLNSKFNYFLQNLTVKAERLNSSNQHLTFLMASTLNNSGRMKGELLVDPNGFSDFVITYTVEEMKISDFNPYADYYVAHPFLDGVCFYSTKSKIDKRVLTSDNKLEIRKIVVGKKQKNKTAVNLPLRFAVALLRDVNGNISIDVPVTGDLDDPKYKLGPIIWQIFKNLILKAVAAPGKLLAKRSGVDEKYLEGFDWKVLQAKMDEEQVKGLDAAVKTLTVSPEMNLEFVKANNFQRELDQLALEQSKRRFLFFNRKIKSEEELSPDEEQVVKSLEPKDSTFNAYVDNELQSRNSLLSIFDKSKRLLGTEKLKAKLQALFDSRSEEIRKYLVEKGLDPSRFRIVDPKEKMEAAYETPSRTVMKFYLADEDSDPAETVSGVEPQ